MECLRFSCQCFPLGLLWRYDLYLSLLSTLSLVIAFKMLDADGNQMVEKKKFFKLQMIISKQDNLKRITNKTEYGPVGWKVVW